MKKNCCRLSWERGALVMFADLMSNLFWNIYLTALIHYPQYIYYFKSMNEIQKTRRDVFLKFPDG